MTTFAVGTVIAPNYEAYARVLARSLDRVHPGRRLNVLVLDEQGAALCPGGAFQALGPPDLPIERARFHAMAAMYSVMELATAVKPWLLRLLLSREADVAIFLDPDIELFAPLDDIVGLAEEHGMVLTPHVTRPIPRDGCRPEEEDILISGTFNLGFIAVSRKALPFLEWWEERLFAHCVVRIDQGLFVDQRWIDLAVQYFPHYVLQDPGFNVAYWNLQERAVHSGAPGYTVNSVPLRAFHYSGYDPSNPRVLSRFTYGRARSQITDQKAVRRLSDAYRTQLIHEEWELSRHRPYGYDAAVDRTPFIPELRDRYRQSVLDSPLGNLPPDPFEPAASAAFEAWVAKEVRAALTRRAYDGLSQLYRLCQRVIRDARFLRFRVRLRRRVKRDRLRPRQG